METPIKNGVGGMVKRSSGYDPNHGDWEYFFIDDVAKIESGRIAACRNCHDTAKASDHVFGTWSRPSIPSKSQKAPTPPLREYNETLLRPHPCPGHRSPAVSQ